MTSRGVVFQAPPYPRPPPPNDSKNDGNWETRRIVLYHTIFDQLTRGPMQYPLHLQYHFKLLIRYLIILFYWTLK